MLFYHKKRPLIPSPLVGEELACPEINSGGEGYLTMDNKLVLFDIDETLIDSGRAGTRSLNIAFEELFSIEDAFKDIRMAGMTDIQIMKEALRIHGFSNDNGEVDALKRKYLENLSQEINNPWREMKPGVQEVLDSLASTSTPLGLLTGNLEAGARIKLTPFGLGKYFTEGAFGSDHEDRNRLLPIAIEKFSRIGINAVPEKSVVIGDTPRDVTCAKIHGAHAIGVATGPYSVDDLKEAGADLVLEDMSDKEACLEYINSI
jgi:phosphoglycolate phosphatase-like HAD superfamily hydrolase